LSTKIDKSRIIHPRSIRIETIYFVFIFQKSRKKIREKEKEKEGKQT